jgi:predicted transcriptional regulator
MKEQTTGEALYAKIKKSLRDSKVSHKEIADELEITPIAFSTQLRTLLEKGNINTKTLEVIEKKTGVKFFNI